MTVKQKETFLTSLGFKNIGKTNNLSDYMWSLKISNSFLGRIEVLIIKSKILVFSSDKNKELKDNNILIIKKLFTKLNLLEIINFLQQ